MKSITNNWFSYLSTKVFPRCWLLLSMKTLVLRPSDKAKDCNDWTHYEGRSA
jgi:hypothetical protein